MDINLKELFHKINKDDIDENATNILAQSLLDSIDVMNLVEAIESSYDITLDADLIDYENFNSCDAIRAMIKKALA